jgi:phage terminase small subunit
MSDYDGEAVAEYIRTKGITRCPTACVLPTQALLGPADRVALEQYAVAREQLQQGQAHARRKAFLTFKAKR